MSAAKKQPYTINPAATAAANAVLLASAGLIDEDAIPIAAPWPVDATAPLATSPAWAGLAGNSAPVAMGDEALRAMGVTYDTAQSGPGPFAPLGVSAGVPDVSLDGLERVVLVETQEGRVAVAAPTIRRFDDDTPARGPLSTDVLTGRIGANYYLSDKVFDTMKDARGWRLHFTRWYPLQRVLVDYFRKPGLDVASDVEQKIRHLRAHNENSPDAKIGYVPLYAGDIPDTNTLVAACDGNVFDLPLRSPAGRF